MLIVYSSLICWFILIVSFQAPSICSSPIRGRPHVSDTSSSMSTSEYAVDANGLFTDQEIPMSSESLAAIRETLGMNGDMYGDMNADMDTAEYAVDQDGLFTDQEIPLSEASMEAIRQATAADQQDINDAEMHTTAEQEVETSDERAEADEDANEYGMNNVDENSESETSMEEEGLEIAAGPSGRMMMMPPSNVHLRTVLSHLMKLIKQMKTNTPLARMALSLRIERMMPRTPITMRLIPSLEHQRSRAALTRCSRLLKFAMLRLRALSSPQMRHTRRFAPRRPMVRVSPHHIKPRVMHRERQLRMKQKLAQWMRRLLSRGARASPTRLKVQRGVLVVEAKRNSTVTLLAPKVRLYMPKRIFIFNRDVNNTFSFPSPSTPPRFTRVNWPRSVHRVRSTSVIQPMATLENDNINTEAPENTDQSHTTFADPMPAVDIPPGTATEN